MGLCLYGNDTDGTTEPVEGALSRLAYIGGHVDILLPYYVVYCNVPVVHRSVLCSIVLGGTVLYCAVPAVYEYCLVSYIQYLEMHCTAVLVLCFQCWHT